MKKRYILQTESGNVASVAWDGKRKPSKKTTEALATLVDLAQKFGDSAQTIANRTLHAALDATGKTKVDFGNQVTISHLKFVRHAQKVKGAWYFNIDNGTDRHNTPIIVDEVAGKIMRILKGK